MITFQEALYLHSLGCPVEVETDHGWLLVRSWETGTLHRLVAGHPERRIHMPEWAMPDWDVISGKTDMRIPVMEPRRATERPETGEARHHRHDVPLEAVLRALYGVGCPPSGGVGGCWRAMCPMCHLRGRWDRRLSIRYMPDGRVLVHCFGGCRTVDVLAALELLPPAPPDHRALDPTRGLDPYR